MNEQMTENINEIFGTLGETWKGALLSAGVTSGIFDLLDNNRHMSVKEVAEEKNYDEGKLDRYFYFLEGIGILNKINGKYFLTEKGMLFTPHSKNHDFTGFVQMTDFYLKASIDAEETFKKGKSLDMLSEGKISKNYQPKVSDRFSEALVGYFQEYKVGGSDSLLDIGCGNGSFLRNLSMIMPELNLTGVDSNLFAIERGRKENNDLKMSKNIKLVVGDITEDLKDFKDESFDWCSAINIFHFIPVDKRLYVIENALRIAKKGIFMTEVGADSTPMSRSGNPMMSLLWNDFTGFFRKTESQELNDELVLKYPKYDFKFFPIMHGNSILVAVSK